MYSVANTTKAKSCKNAAAVEGVGAGLTILDAELTPERIAVAARRLLDDGEWRAAAGRVSEQIAAMPGPGDRVRLIQQLARTHQ
jgi:UDP:flavonoid glycosyltransferase YjiC (YdhE family)